MGDNQEEYREIYKLKGYFPKAGESAIIDRIPGTHASCSLLANIVQPLSWHYLLLRYDALDPVGLIA